MHDHNLVDSFPTRSILVEQRAVKDRAGAPVEGLHNVWIALNNPSELNAYTTDMVKEIILALRAASNDRAAVAVVLTGAGSRAFCAGGTRASMPRTMPAIPANIANTCGCSTTWLPRCCSATNRWYAASTVCA